MSKLREPKQNKEPFQILVLDDEHSIRWVLERTLAQAGYIPFGSRRSGSATTAPETFY
jgi:DNA-binding NtrC family response regulator